MTRARHKLSAAKIKNTETGTLYDGGGLQLQKTSRNSGKWIYRYSFLGKRRDMGLGSFPSIGLANARSFRDHWEHTKISGRDPVEAREDELAQKMKQLKAFDPTFEEAVEKCRKHNAAKLKRGGDAGRWRSPLDTHAIPLLGKRRVSTLKVPDIKRVLEPIWTSRQPTAEKVVQRTRMVLKYCADYEAQADPDIVNKAVGQLPIVNHKTSNIASTPWRNTPALYKRLSKPTASNLALRLLILTAQRADSVCGARVKEIEGDVWTIPASRMKSTESQAKDFRVPLMSGDLEQLEESWPKHRSVRILSELLKILLDDRQKFFGKA